MLALRAARLGAHSVQMAEVLLFHHVLGQTPGFWAFVNELRAQGNTVHTPDLFEGRTFDSLPAGLEYAGSVGFGTLLEQGVASAEGLPEQLVYAGFSLGVLPAQRLAQTRAGAQGALLFYSAVPPAEFGGPWPADVPVQVHGMDADPFFVGEGDIEAARELVGQADRGELFLYPGDGHIFLEPGVEGYDADAAALLTARAVGFLAAFS